MNGKTITLTNEELVALTYILDRVGGSPAESLRGYIDSILEKIQFRQFFENADKDSADYELIESGIFIENSGHIYFNVGSKTANKFLKDLETVANLDG